MRPWAIMGSAAVIALTMMPVIVREYNYGGVIIDTKGGNVIVSRPSSTPRRTTVETNNRNP
jgi:hypothetical protein